jgi:hypothetical protein
MKNNINITVCSKKTILQMIKESKITKKDIAKRLSISSQGLNKRLKDPENLTIKQLRELLSLIGGYNLTLVVEN